MLEGLVIMLSLACQECSPPKNSDLYADQLVDIDSIPSIPEGMGKMFSRYLL
jgi:hypothetical protein